ncbi:hypothetical protein PFISCL1PPCAC_4445, partial [Pristionchus fissidentatus]
MDSIEEETDRRMLGEDTMNRFDTLLRHSDNKKKDMKKRKILNSNKKKVVKGKNAEKKAPAPAPPPKIKCPYCTKVWREEGAAMAQHLSVRHPNAPMEVVNYVICKDIVCDYRTSDAKALAHHNKLSHSVSVDNARFPSNTRCPYCTLTLWNLAQFKNHMMDQHRSEICNNKNPILICVDCSFKCARIHEMVQHWNEHNNSCNLGITFDYEATDSLIGSVVYEPTSLQQVKLQQVQQREQQKALELRMQQLQQL